MPLLLIARSRRHGGQSKDSGLDLSTREGLLRGGDSGPANR
ncbi:MAG: hypothetical protein DMG05_19805 [Acidobacteria bacterium]|nr:MAG: hypothetical protein DMG05_19805 [Acidobacteriota bacterium]